MKGPARAICLFIVVALTASLMDGFVTGRLVADQLYVWRVIWGRYVWADAYSGFLLFAMLIQAYERNVKLTVALFILTCLTGNMVNTAWLLWRCPDLLRRIRHTNPGSAS